ncbi:hypothetical protein IAU59_005829 [Kwoniella sp. CBS 9459]
MDLDIAGPSTYYISKNKEPRPSANLDQRYDHGAELRRASWRPSRDEVVPEYVQALDAEPRTTIRTYLDKGETEVSGAGDDDQRNVRQSTVQFLKSYRRRRRKRLKSIISLISVLSHTLLLSSLAICLLPLCAAQDTDTSLIISTSSSTRATLSTSTGTFTATTSSSSSQSASSNALAASTRTYSLPTIPTSLSLPALNTSVPAIQLDLPSISSIYLTFSICTLTSDQSLLPNILVSTIDPPNFDLDSSSKLIYDRDSGGLGQSKTGWNQRVGKNGNTWLINWEKGFGNYTFSTSSSDDNDDDGDSDGDSGEGSDEGEQVPMSILFDLGTADDEDGGAGVTGNMVIQMSASTQGPLNTISPSLPFLGDTTSSLALLFSPLLVSTTRAESSYPNYTLPSPQLVFEPFASIASDGSSDGISRVSSGNSSLSNTNLTLAIVPTASSPTNSGLDYSICAIRSTLNSTGDLPSDSSGNGNSNGNIVLRTPADEPQWSSLDEEEGYRHFWAVGALTPGTNYSAWVIDQEGVLAGPIWFVMKPESFPCNLVLPTSICPGIAYAAPIPANETTTTITITSPTDLTDTSTVTVNAPIQSLPDETIALLTANLQSFRTSLLSHACGRDLYSHVSSCGDCFEAYRDWLCRTVVPRCSAPNNTVTDADNVTGNNSTASSDDQFPSPKIVHRTPSSSSSSSSNSSSESDPLSALPSIEVEYDQLLPCLSNCNKVDRACPVDMGFRCPRRTVNAELDYAFYGHDDEHGHGGKDDVVSSNNRYGRRWCNG